MLDNELSSQFDLSLWNVTNDDNKTADMSIKGKISSIISKPLSILEGRSNLHK